jgi:hypothetical protein
VPVLGTPEEMEARFGEMQRLTMELAPTVLQDWRETYEPQVEAAADRILDFDYAGSSTTEVAQFRRQFHAPIASGEVTRTVRRWLRPQARAGGRYRLGTAGSIEVDRIAPTTADVLTLVGLPAGGRLHRPRARDVGYPRRGLGNAKHAAPWRSVRGLARASAVPDAPARG